MDWKKEIKILLIIAGLFLIIWFLPVESISFRDSVMASFDLARWYAREHVILCLIPAFFIAGVISIFLSQASVLKYLGANAKKWVSYTVASVSGSILAVCSCTILPLFSSIHKRGAGLGPAITFLYSGPGINILAIILTARILGFEMGVARVIGAVAFSIIIGILMSLIYRKEEKANAERQMKIVVPPESRPLWQTFFHFATLVIILVFANWGKPAEGVTEGAWFFLWSNKWFITAIAAVMLAFSMVYMLKTEWWKVAIASAIVLISALLFKNPIIVMVTGMAALSVITLLKPGENREWTLSTWDFAKQIMPLLAVGVVIAGFLLGSTHGDTSIPGIIPNSWISSLVGGNSLFSNFFASMVGAFMYFRYSYRSPNPSGP